MITIDKNIPIPNLTRKSKYPFHEMEVGDSFLAINRNSVQAGMSVHNKNGKKFISRKTPEGIRVWRIK